MTESNSPTPTKNHFGLPPSLDHHSVQITNIRLNRDNFLCWSLAMRMYIYGRGKIGYLTGDKTEPEKTIAQHATWDAKNSMVMAWLVNFMEKDISANYIGYSTANDMWDNLSQIYSGLGNQTQIYEL
ncbi:hypothetical protein LWI29_024352 [Acer saccharum]|uniref:Retrotransposon Copia-like N-terminal domain-containing protein n=1 Tax=Acer saccharum TaxID=4024 RepID=A0AA39VBP4_ACESA|nr:hypothetical protein LWI29_024352 [Acer saccharum]